MFKRKPKTCSVCFGRGWTCTYGIDGMHKAICACPAGLRANIDDQTGFQPHSPGWKGEIFDAVMGQKYIGILNYISDSWVIWTTEDAQHCRARERIRFGGKAA